MLVLGKSTMAKHNRPIVAHFKNRCALLLLVLVAPSLARAELITETYSFQELVTGFVIIEYDDEDGLSLEDFETQTDNLASGISSISVDTSFFSSPDPECESMGMSGTCISMESFVFFEGVPEGIFNLELLTPLYPGAFGNEDFAFIIASLAIDAPPPPGPPTEQCSKGECTRLTLDALVLTSPETLAGYALKFAGGLYEQEIDWRLIGNFSVMEVSGVPVPATLWLLGLASLSCLGIRRRNVS